jgi:hypothetical protein
VRLSAGDLPGPTAVGVVAGLAVLIGGLVLRRGTLATIGLALLGAGYGISLAGRGLDPAAVLFAGGLVAIAELAFWALEPGAAVRIGRAATGRRALTVAAVVFGAVLSGALLLAAVSDPLRGGAALGIAGVLALLTIVAVAAVLARSLRDDAGEM